METLKILLCLTIILPWLNCQCSGKGPVLGLFQPDDAFDLDVNPGAAESNKDEQQPFHIPHYEAIVGNLTSVQGNGLTPSYLALFGKDVFPVVSDGGSVVIAAGLYGKGRIFVGGHAGFVLSQTADPGLNQLTQNAIQWLAQADQLEGISMAVATGESVGGIEATNGVAPHDLDNSKYQVYYTTMYQGMTDESIEKIIKFVENGGGLIVVGQIWSWYYDHGGVLNGLANDGNRLLKHFGVLMGSEVGTASTLTSDLHRSLFYALGSIDCEAGTEIVVSPAAAATIGRTGQLVLNLNTNFDPKFQEIMALGLNAFDCLPSVSDRALISSMVSFLLPVVLLQNPTSIMKAKDHAAFPGSVPDDAERVTETLKVNGTYIGYPTGFGYSGAGSPLFVSTGLYAPAGSVIKVSLDPEFFATLPSPSPFDVQIGCHTDQLYNKPGAPRSPQIVTVSAINGPETIAANPWGGLVYIRVHRDAKFPMFDVTISNVVRSPHFVLGKHTNEDWKAKIRNHPGPWGELEISDQIVLTVPSTALRNYEDQEELLVMYKEIMSLYNFLQGFEGSYRFRAERIVLDAEISGGWMHAGYPLMGYMDYAPSLINPRNAKGGSAWGEFHELGHNGQWIKYTTGATTESGCNVYAHYVNKKLFNETSRFVQSRTDAFLAGFLMDGGGTAGYGGQVAVLSYTLLLDRYGFEHWRNMNRFYMENPNEVEGETYDVFAWVMATVMKMDTCPYYSFFGFQLTERTLAACRELPAMPDLIIDRYDSVMADAPPAEGQCPPGWLQHGASCFLVSNEESSSVQWDQADQTCRTLDDRSHLASCFSEEEAFFLARHFKQNNVQGSYHVGIDENNVENVPKYLDQSPLPDLLPWQEYRPAKDGKRCTKMEGGWLYDVPCNTKAGVICKTGPTSCAPTMNCPEGWTKFVDKCYWMFFGGVGFDAAVEDCKSKGASLLEIDSPEESDFFNTWVKEARWAGQYYWRNYWLGMEDIPSGKWLSGAPLAHREFCGDADLSAREGVLASIANSYCWNGLKRNQNEAYICEKFA